MGVCSVRVLCSRTGRPFYHLQVVRVVVFVKGPPLNSTAAGDQAIIASGGYGTPMWGGAPSKGPCPACYKPPPPGSYDTGLRYWGESQALIT